MITYDDLRLSLIASLRVQVLRESLALLLVGEQAATDHVLLVVETVGHEGEGDADYAINYEVHFRNILLFIIDHFVFVSGLEASGHEAEGYVVEEPLLVLCTNIEEPLELSEYVKV